MKSLLKYWLPACIPLILGWYAWSQTPSVGIGKGTGGGVASITAAGIKLGNYCAAASASTTTYTCTPTNASTLAAGQVYLFVPDETNTGNSTLNINGAGAKSILHKDGDQFAAGDIVDGDTLPLLYDGTQFVPLFELLSTNPGLNKFSCGTAPGTPASDKVFNYCTSDVPHWKDDAGNVLTPQRAITCSAGDFVNTIPATGIPACGTPSGGGSTDVKRFFPAAGGYNGAPVRLWYGNNSNVGTTCTDESAGPYPPTADARCVMFWSQTDASVNYAMFTDQVPAGWTAGTITVGLWFIGNNSNNTVQYKVSYSCTADTEAAQTFSTAQNLASTATTALNMYYKTVALSGVTCVAGDFIRVAFARVDTAGFSSIFGANVTYAN